MDPIAYQVIRSRRKTISIQITPDGRVVVRCPLRLSRREIRNFVEKEQNWILPRLEKARMQLRQPKLTEEQLEVLTDRAKEVFAERSAEFSSRMGVRFHKITIRHQKTRWGSCSAAGNLSFNCLLVLAPPEVLDYVVVHELAHRIEMNHSPAFWAQVERILPDYRSRRQWLKEQGGELIARLP